MNDLFGFEDLFPLEWSPCVCVCVCKPGWSVWVMAVRVSRRESPESTAHDTPPPYLLLLISLSFILQRPHLFFSVMFPSTLLSWPVFLPSESVWVSRNLRQKGRAACTQRAFITLYWSFCLDSSLLVWLLFRSNSSLLYVEESQGLIGLLILFICILVRIINCTAIVNMWSKGHIKSTSCFQIWFFYDEVNVT